jgi:hypothetical protein
MDGAQMTDFEDFSKLARRWAPFYRTRETTYIVLETNGMSVLLYSLEAFLIGEPINLPPLQVETKTIHAGQFRVPLSQNTAPQSIEDALTRRGTVALSSGSAGLGRENDFSTYSGPAARFERKYPTRMPGPMRLPCFVLQHAPVDLRKIKDLIDLELIACDVPYDNMEELCVELKAPLSIGEFVQSTFSEIILEGLLTVSGNSILKDDRLLLTINTPKDIEPDKLKITIKSYFSSTSAPRRTVLPSQNATIEKSGDMLMCSFVVPMSGIHLATALVSYDGEYCFRWIFKDQTKSYNERFQVHRLLDNFSTFEKSFFASKNNFEQRVALLLSMLNLIVLPYGGIPELQDAPDLLAYSSINDLYVVECTTGDIDQKGKLQKLRDRTREITQRLQQSPLAIANVLSIVVTSMPRQEIAPHLTKLEALQIAIFCKEDLDRALERLEVPYTPLELRAMVQAAIPTRLIPLTQGDL